VRKGSLTADFDWVMDQETPGLLIVDLARLSAIEPGQSRLLDLDLRVSPEVAPGSYRIDLEWASGNDGRLTLRPASEPTGPDAADRSFEARPALVAVSRTTDAVMADGPEATTIDVPAEPPPVIDWSAGRLNRSGVEIRGKHEGAGGAWTVDFVTSLAQSEDSTHANDHMKVKVPPVAAR
jgi:hypothetical protein